MKRQQNQPKVLVQAAVMKESAPTLVWTAIALLTLYTSIIL